MSDDSSATHSFVLSIEFSGASADRSRLNFEEYAQSLDGWQRFFRMASDLKLRAEIDFGELRLNDVLDLQIRPEREGSFLTVVEFVLLLSASEWIKKGANQSYEVCTKRLIKWFRDLVAIFVETKRKTTNVEEIAAALEQMVTQNGIDLTSRVVATDEQMSLDVAEDDNEDLEEGPRASKQRQITERLDEQLMAATQPLERSCTRIRVLDTNKTPLITLGSIERAVIVEPLTLPPPKRDWVEASVKFVRIHKQTGRAMFYFKKDNESAYGAHFSRIIDPRVREAGNPYTTAFNDNEFLPVWVRQRMAPKGRLNVQWEITVQAPEIQGLLP